MTPLTYRNDKNVVSQDIETRIIIGKIIDSFHNNHRIKSCIVNLKHLSCDEYDKSACKIDVKKTFKRMALLNSTKREFKLSVIRGSSVH